MRSTIIKFFVKITKVFAVESLVIKVLAIEVMKGFKLGSGSRGSGSRGSRSRQGSRNRDYRPRPFLFFTFSRDNLFVIFAIFTFVAIFFS